MGAAEASKASLLGNERDAKKLNLDMALQRVGGFGMFQFLALLSLSLWRNAGNFLVYIFAYLNLAQKYECRSGLDQGWESCDAATVICPALDQGTSLEYRVDTSYTYFMENWQQELGLMCTSASAINLPYMLYFILFGVGGILTSSLTDKLGRRRSHWLFSTGHLIAQALILFVPSQIAHVIGFSMLGFFMAKNTLCFTYAFEFMVKDHKGCASTCLNMLDFSVCVIAGLFFLLATPRWELLCYPLFAAGAIGFVIVSLLLPESPKWLLLQGRQADAISALNYIARINRSPHRIDADTIFVEAVIAGNLENNETYNAEQSMSQAISQLSFRATQLFESRQGALSAPKQQSFVRSILLFMVMMCSLQIQYFSIYFLGASIGGNKFVNLMLIGVGEMIGGALSGFALTRMSDHRVFQIVTLISSSMNLVFYAVPEGLPSYTCFMLFIMGIAGQFNAIMIIVELRVPPENTGAAFQILLTAGTMAATLSPLIASVGQPWTMLFPTALATLNFFLTCWLDEPGKYLPKAVPVSDNVTWLKLETVNQVVNDSIQNSLNGFGPSFELSFYERTHQVQRPRLNETNMDPGLIGEDEEQDTQVKRVSWGAGAGAGDRSYSRVIKNWDWDMAALPHQHEVELSVIHKYMENATLEPILENH